MKDLKIGIIGCGYIGLICGTCWANMGHNVIGVDKNQKLITDLRDGVLPFYESGLEEIFHSSIQNWSFTNSYRDLSSCDYIVVCVATPTDSIGNIDLSHLTAVISELSKHISDDMVSPTLVFRSTMPPGTIDKLVKPLTKSMGDIDVIHFPEFLREGNAIRDFMNPPRVVIGASKRNIAEQFFNNVCCSIETNEVFITTIQNSEFAKYMDNTWHACKVAFANELSAIASKYSVNLADMYNIFKSDNVLNISDKYLRPGAPYGGSCLRKDTDGLKGLAMQKGVKAPLVESINISNMERIMEIINFVKKNSVSDDKILIEGFSFKAGTSDVREAPQQLIRESLEDFGLNVDIFDPIYSNYNKNDHGALNHEDVVRTSYDFIIRFQALLVEKQAKKYFLDYSGIPEINEGCISTKAAC